MRHLHDLDVLILGLGDSGLAMARWCARHGARVRVWDSRDAPPQADALAADVPGAVRLRGPLQADQLAPARLVLKSPGLAPHDGRIAPLLDAARAQGLAIGGELDLFARALADLKSELGYAPKVLAITGTNGKTTTTAMCAQLVERCGLRVAMAGNIGPTLLDTLADLLDREPAPDAVPHAPDAPDAPDADPAALDPGARQDAGDAAAQGAIEAAEQGGVEASASGAAPKADGLAAVVSGEGTEAPQATEAAALTPPDDPDGDAPAWVPAPPPPAAPTFEVLPQVWVLELSSFQLHGVQGFAPDASVVLNISQDHLDWHGDLAAYTADKARIYGEQAVMVVNRDDPAVEALVPAPVVIKAAGRGQRARTVARNVVRFGLDAPQRPGDFGLVTEGGMAWLVRAREQDETLKRRKDEADEILLQRLMPADALRVRGRHNAANALAALALATAIGCPLAPMLHGLREYRGEPHRVAYVASVGDVACFDDSKGTNVGATVAALLGLGADMAPARLTIILGGDGKGQDFAPLAAPLARHARAVALIGRDGPTIADAVAPALVAAGVPWQSHASLPEAVAWCFGQARPGDALLLSPACASLDMFRNYAHRADVFVAAVHDHAHRLGEALA